jgi:hypothetical protein
MQVQSRTNDSNTDRSDEEDKEEEGDGVSSFTDIISDGTRQYEINSLHQRHQFIKVDAAKRMYAYP